MWLFLLLVPSAVLSASVDSCEPARNIGINMTAFSQNVGHLVHSLSVEDIRYFFDDQFPIDNTVPTVNFDLTGTPVLKYAPSRPSAFKFPAGAAIDFILSNNDQRFKFGSAGDTNLEEIVHQMHMLEMWKMASKVYRDIKAKGVDTQKVCPCLVNEEENGLIDHMALIFKAFQEWIPYKIVEGERRIPIRASRTICNYKSNYPPKIEREGRHIKGEMYKFINGEEYQIVPELKDSKSWNSYWKSKVISSEHDEQQLFSFAMYMYCKINFA